MRVLMVTDTPFAGLLHRPQQLAIGMARQGHDVLYLAPTTAYRHAYDFAVSRAAPAGVPGTASGTASGTAPGASPGGGGEAVPGASVDDSEGSAIGMDLPAGLVIRELDGMEAVRPVESLKEAWERWAELAARHVRQLERGDAPAGDGVFAPEVICCDHPSLLPAIKETATAPVVIDCSEDFEAQTGSRSAIEAYREALSTALPLADGLIAHNRYVIESWDRYLGEDVPRTVIEHGVDVDLFSPTSSERASALRRGLELQPGQSAITFLGHVDARISYEDLVTMMETAPEAVFVFVGQVRPDGLSLLQRLPSDRIRPLGALRPEKAAAIVGASDALILPFRREPHLEVVRGLNLYEYFATGRPIAASFRRALKAYRDLMYLYATQAELQQSVRALLAEAKTEAKTGDRAGAKAGDKARRRIEIAREAAWSRRVDELIGFLGRVSVRQVS